MARGRRMLSTGIAGLFLAATFLPSTAAAKKTTLKIIMWQNPPAVEAIAKINAEFEKRHPGIKVDLTTFPSATYFDTVAPLRVTANDVDILADQMFKGEVQPWAPGASKRSWQEWIDGGLIEPLSGQSFLRNYLPEALQNASTYKGTVYSVPTGAVSYTGVFYNKDIFAKYGLSAPRTFQELMKTCEILSAGGIAPFTMAAKDVWPLALPVNGLLASLCPDPLADVKRLWTGDLKFTDQKMLQVYEHMQKIMYYAEKGFIGVDNLSVTGRFAVGKAAMLPDGIWQAPSIEKANPMLKFGYFPLPGSDNPEDNRRLAGKYDLAWMVLKKSKQKKEAMKWLEFFSRPANYALYVNAVGFIPTQPRIKLTNKFLAEVAPLASNFKLAWDQVMINKKDLGQYASYDGFPVHYLKPMGELDPGQLALKAQSDWDAKTIRNNPDK